MLSLEEKIGQMLVVGFHGLEPPDYILDWLSSGRIGGVILFARNIASPAQVAELTQACHEAARHPILIAIDQEGGIVTRLRDGFTESPGAMALGAADSKELAEKVAWVLGTELHAMGINWNLAPVVDLTHDINNPSVGTRSLGSDKMRVSKLASAQIHGFQRAGVAATAKHFPGIGYTPVDTHDAQAVVECQMDYFREHDLVPFHAAVDAGVAAIMISHVTCAAVDPQYPATLSPRIIQGILREEVGFSGMVCTDCMEMRAIADHHKPGESAVLAALAGEDLIFFSHSFSPTNQAHAAAYDELLHAVRNGRVPPAQVEQAVQRVQAVKARFAITSKPRLDSIRCADHLVVMDEAARAGVVVVRGGAELLPLRPDLRAGVIEFASVVESGIVEQGGMTGLGTLLHNRAPWIEQVTLKSVDSPAESLAHARQLAGRSDLLILATRNAHLIPQQAAAARELLRLAPSKSLLLCLRNPYDMNVLPEAHAVICTCGDSNPSLQAAVDALLGDFVPSGSLPVPMESMR